MGPFGELSENSEGYVPNFGRTAPVDDDIMVHAEIEMRKNIFLINLGELAILREDIVPNLVCFFNQATRKTHWIYSTTSSP